MDTFDKPLSDEEIREQVRTLLRENTNEGYSTLLKSHYCYIRPSRKRYLFQWFWDTCFHVFMLSALGEHEEAKHNLRSLFVMQRIDGFVGHMIFWRSLLPTHRIDFMQARPTWKHIRPRMSALIQPSFVAQALQRIFKETDDMAFLQEIFPKVKKYLDWLGNNRDFDGDGLLSIITPFESGMDFKPSFDEVLGVPPGRPRWKLLFMSVYVDLCNFLRHYDLRRIAKAKVFVVKEVTVNTAYAKDLLALSHLCKAMGEESEAAKYKALSLRVMQSMLNVMYDAETAAFYDVVGGTNKKLKVLTPSIVFPAILPEIPKDLLETVMKRHLFSKEEFAAPYPIPSVAMNEPSFYPGRSFCLWRGPTWIFTNWFVFRCLLECGFHEKADELLAATKRLIQERGFYEYYDPMTGEGLGEANFTWSGFVVDMMHIHENRRRHSE